MSTIHDQLRRRAAKQAGDARRAEELREIAVRFARVFQGPDGEAVLTAIWEQAFAPSISEKQPNSNTALMKEGKQQLARFIENRIEEGMRDD